MATDEECAFSLAENGQNPYLAAACIAETKAAHFLNRPITTKRGDRTTTYGDPVQGFLTLARTLRMQASTKTAFVYAGGLSVSEHVSDGDNQELVQPFARKNLHTTPPGPHTGRPAPWDPAREPW